MSHTYIMKRTETGCTAHVSNEEGEKALPPRNDLFNHSPDGFEWGYGGSGPAQLALALLAHEFGDGEALEWYQTFKREVISQVSQDINHWTITSEDLATLMEKVKSYG